MTEDDAFDDLRIDRPSDPLTRPNTVDALREAADQEQGMRDAGAIREDERYRRLDHPKAYALLSLARDFHRIARVLEGAAYGINVKDLPTAAKSAAALAELLRAEIEEKA